jgi:hypothetical protein
MLLQLTVVKAQQLELKIGLGAWGVFYAPSFYDDGQLIIRPDGGYDGERFSFDAHLWKELSPRIAVGTGLSFFYMFRSHEIYIRDEDDDDSFFFLPFSGYDQYVSTGFAHSFAIPLYGKFNLDKHFYLKAGIVNQINLVAKFKDYDITESAQANAILRSMKKFIHPYVLSYELGIGLTVWKLDAHFSMTDNMTQVSHEFLIKGTPFRPLRHFKRFHLALQYTIPFK